MSSYRYPGAQPFSTDQKNIFFGRNQDIQDLYRLINLENLIVLYSKSGLGKSSLINAGIVPRVLKKGKYKPISIRFGSFQEGKEEMPLYLVKQALTEGWEGDTFLDRVIPEEDSLWYHTKEQQIKKGGNLHFLLIFDQFEELFTYPKAAITRFKQEVSELLHTQIPQRFREIIEQAFQENKPLLSNEEMNLLHKPFDLKIVMAIRSDRMSLLNQLSSHFPTILKNCYELGPLTPEQAEEAILNPAYKKSDDFICPPFDYENEAIESMLDFLTRGGKEGIESFQLQILCQSIERKVINYQLPVITEADLGNVEQVYENYYDDQIKLLGSKEEQESAQKLIEEGLIFEEEERRLSLFEGVIYRTFKVSPELLRKLVDAHLLRAEPSMKGGYTYELSHDTLVGPVLRSKQQRVFDQERQAAEEARQKREAELEEARRQARTEKKKRQRARMLAVAGFLLAIISLLASGFAYHWYVEADAAKLQADQNAELARQGQAKAEEARLEALDSYKRAEEQKEIAISNEELAKVAEAKAQEYALYAEGERGKAIKAQKEAEALTKIVEGNGNADLADQIKETNPTYAIRFAQRALEADSTNKRAEGIIMELEPRRGKPRKLFFQKEVDSNSRITSMGISNSGGFYATGEQNGEVKIWSSEGKLLHTLPGQKQSIKALSFSPDGSLLLSTSLDGSIKLWRANATHPTRNLLHTFEVLSSGNNPAGLVKFYSGIFSPDGKFILCGGDHGIARMWYADPKDNANFGKLKQIFVGHNDEDIINDLAFSDDGQLIITGSADNTVRLWDLNGNCLKILADPGGAGKDVMSVAFYPKAPKDTLMVFGGTLVNNINVWKIPKAEIKSRLDTTVILPSSTFSVHQGRVSQLKFFEQQGRQYLLTSGVDERLKVWTFTQNKRINKDTTRDDLSNTYLLLGGMKGEVQASFLPAESQLISVDASGKMLFWALDQKPIYYDRSNVKNTFKSINIASLPSSHSQDQGDDQYEVDMPQKGSSSPSDYTSKIRMLENEYRISKDEKVLEPLGDLYEEMVNWDDLGEVDILELLQIELDLYNRRRYSSAGGYAKKYRRKLQDYFLSEEGLRRSLETNEAYCMRQYARLLERMLATKPADQQEVLLNKIRKVYDKIVNNELWKPHGPSFYGDLITNAIYYGPTNRLSDTWNEYFESLYEKKLTSKDRLKSFSAGDLRVIAYRVYSKGTGSMRSDSNQVICYDKALECLDYALEKEENDETKLQLAMVCGGSSFGLVYLEHFEKAIELGQRGVDLGKLCNPGNIEEDLAYTNLVMGYLFSDLEYGKDKAFEIYSDKWDDPYWRPNYENFKGIFLKDLKDLKWFFQGQRRNTKKVSDQEKYDGYLELIEEAEEYINTKCK